MSKKKPDPAILPYRPCVGMAVFNRAGLVWAGRRIAEPSSEMDGAAQLWQLPQGGIERGEDPYAAALRELYEETGMRSVSLLAEAPEWFRYDLPAHLVGVALKGRFRGQEQKWFAFRFEGDESEIAIDPPPGGNHAEFDRWDWLPLSTLPGLIVPFKRPVYDRLVDAFGSIAG